ncbi:MAG: PfkB family carbohydrate kinase [Friedmanniella sp.]|jgi:D-beta-D-heptose 7-phosphate kinase / D-beta-D-heptose 1-phosphate adenosyltransferase
MMRRGPLVVVGDCLLDVDLVGSATRLAPDAPVPVVDVTERWERPGGAGLAALLAARTEVEVVLVTALGEDDAALTLGALLAQHVNVCPLRLDGDTVVKTRIGASGVPMLRLDTGNGRAADTPLPRSVAAALATAGAILVSDYGRGVTALPALRRRLESVASEVPVIWDPHPRGAQPVGQAALVTPNAAESRHFAAEDDVITAGRRLCRQWQARAVVVTQGERGATLVPAGSAEPVPVPLVRAASVADQQSPDTCGAGDQFAASAATAMLGGAGAEAAVRVAVKEASAYVGAGAAASVSVRAPARVDTTAGPQPFSQSAVQSSEVS